MPNKIKLKLTSLSRDLALDASEADLEARTIPAVISTEYPVDRDGYREVLIHRTGSIDLSRAPLPLLEQHGADRLNIGVVRDLRVVNSELRGTVVIGSSPRAKELWPDIRDRVVTNLSIGYRILEYAIVGETLKATRWQPFEVSLVSVPADPGAGLYRSNTMPQENNQHASPEEIAASERSRALEINQIAGNVRASLPNVDALALTAIRENMDAAAFRAQVINALADADARAGGNMNRAFENYFVREEVRNGNDFTAAASDALLARAGVRVSQAHAAARDFRGLSVLDMARICIERSGRTFRGADTPEILLRQALSTSDFPALLGDTLGKAMRMGQESEPASHRVWCAITEAADFRTLSRVILGSAPDLEEVAELGEYTNGPFTEDKTTLTPKKFGRLVSISWESLLADNLGAFVGMGRSFGQAAMRAEADAIYNALVANALAGPNLLDGVALFHSSRNNAVTGGANLDAASLGAARAKLRRQTNTGGGLLNLSARFLLVPPELETAAEMLVAASSVHGVGSSTEAGTPAWISNLTVVAEPRLQSTSTVYLVADPNIIGTGEVAIVGGEPTIEEIEEKKSDKLTWKVRHAFAAGFIDFRGIVKLTLGA